MKDEFYIGWMDHSPAGSARRMRKVVLALLAFTCMVSLLGALAQRHYSRSNFEWGRTRTFSGILHLNPIPYLQLDADPEWTEGFSTSAALVAPFKWGLSSEALAKWEGKHIEIEATRIHREQQWMLECVPESIRESKSVRPLMTSTNLSLGSHQLVGEIVDSKCWMGVMNPGGLKTHKACAVQCLRGGIPPMLVIRRQNDFPLNLFLVPQGSTAIPDALLDHVAEPVEIRGEMRIQDGLVLFVFDPASVRTLDLERTAHARGQSDPVCGLH